MRGRPTKSLNVTLSIDGPALGLRGTIELSRWIRSTFELFPLGMGCPTSCATDVIASTLSRNELQDLVVAGPHNPG